MCRRARAACGAGKIELICMIELRRRRLANFFMMLFMLPGIVRPASAQVEFEKCLSSAEERLRRQDLRGAEKLNPWA